MNIDKTKSSPAIARDLNALSATDIRAHHEIVTAAMLKEVKRWLTRGVVERMSKQGADNRIDPRWVIARKIIDGQRDGKGRLAVRGFKDRQKRENCCRCRLAVRRKGDLLHRGSAWLESLSP